MYDLYIEYDNIWPRYNYLKTWNLRVQKKKKKKNRNIEKTLLKVVQITFLAMHITKQKLLFDIFTIGNVLISSWNMICT